MTTHELKTWPVYFRELVSGAKTFEFRKNDRHFQRGDVLHLREWDKEESHIDTLRYTGRDLWFEITYVLTGIEGLQDGYAVLAISEIDESEAKR